MTIQEKINKIHQLFLSNDAVNWELASSLIESQQLRELYPYAVWHQGALTQAQKLEYLRQIEQRFTVAKLGKILAGRIWAIADEMMEFLRHHPHSTAFIEAHQRGKSIMYRVQTILPPHEADTTKTRLEYYSSYHGYEAKRAYVRHLKDHKHAKWCHVPHDYMHPTYQAESWLNIARKTSEPLQYDIQPIDDENTQISVLVWLPFSSCRSYQG